MTEKQLRQKVVAQARAWLGEKESDGSHKEILDVYNRLTPLPRGYRMKDTDPWCAAFVSAVGAAADMSDVIMPECSCDYMAAAYRAKGAYKDRGYRGQPGDLIFYNWDGDASLDHVGIIEELLQGGYLIIEGNKSDAVGRRSIPGDWTLIAGIAVPDYAAKAGEAAPADEQPPDVDGKPLTTNSFPILKRGNRGETVRAAQFLLNGRGFSCGIWGADADFGNMTEAAVLAFQRRNGLEVDGVIGRVTWSYLLGLR